MLSQVLLCLNSLAPYVKTALAPLAHPKAAFTECLTCTPHKPQFILVAALKVNLPTLLRRSALARELLAVTAPDYDTSRARRTAELLKLRLGEGAMGAVEVGCGSSAVWRHCCWLCVWSSACGPVASGFLVHTVFMFSGEKG